MLYKPFLKILRPCPFCYPADLPFADRKTAYLTYALAPYVRHHLLVIPKRHVISVNELGSSEEKEIADLVKSGIQILHRLGIKSCTVFVRDGEENKMKSVQHLHYHIIPNRRIGDLDGKGRPRRILTEREIENLKRNIEKVLSL